MHYARMYVYINGQNVSNGRYVCMYVCMYVYIQSTYIWLYVKNNKLLVSSSSYAIYIIFTLP